MHTFVMSLKAAEKVPLPCSAALAALRLASFSLVAMAFGLGVYATIATSAEDLAGAVERNAGI
ncbi:MAG: hypothetical protein WBE08_11140 [Methyloceanibacter sp.]